MSGPELNQIRRSMLISSAGPGAIVDFRMNEALVSAVVTGLEQWDCSFPEKGLMNDQCIFEPRLQKLLRVNGFRLPPVIFQNYSDSKNNPDTRSIPAVRFPEWLQCSRCGKIAHYSSKEWKKKNSENPEVLICKSCLTDSDGEFDEPVVPVRFILTCNEGHLNDFPWHDWVRHTPGCSNARGHLFLKSERPGLEGLFVSCPKCKQKRSLEGIFTRKVVVENGIRCFGKRPWSSSGDQKCSDMEPPRVLQRGASNIYYPVTESAISIPPWSDDLQAAFGVYWSHIESAHPDDRKSVIRTFFNNGTFNNILEDFDLTPEGLTEEIERRIDLANKKMTESLLEEEYRQFLSGRSEYRSDDKEFETRESDVPDELSNVFSRIIRVLRLREVKALKGFTRINPPDSITDSRIIPLSDTKKDWLPAVEVRGEGIFIEINQEAINKWEKSNGWEDRVRTIEKAWVENWKSKNSDGDIPMHVTPAFLLVHTFAHALMRQFTLECGYSGAALRERLYVGDSAFPMSGVLIYTATTDSDGSLGGLQRLGRPERIVQSVLQAIRAMEWCSSDPLCIQGHSIDQFSLAACHACVLAPETSCEHFNRFLDRATLVGISDKKIEGFFSEYLSGE